jgi:hypothetical protein
MLPARRSWFRTLVLLVAGVSLASACATSADESRLSGTISSATDSERPPVFRYPPAPTAPASDVADAPDVRDAMVRLDTQLRVGEIDEAALADLVDHGDARHAWYVADLMRFFGAGDSGNELVDAFETLTGVSIADDPDSERSVWLSATNHLIAWDTPDYPDYRTDKADLFLLVDARWEPFFADDADIDWRNLSWGGVLIDDRELGDPGGCSRGCIPALDDPAVTDAAGGDWYPDDAVVFGISRLVEDIGRSAVSLQRANTTLRVAYPKIIQQRCVLYAADEVPYPRGLAITGCQSGLHRRATSPEGEQATDGFGRAKCAPFPLTSLAHAGAVFWRESVQVSKSP